MIFFYAILFFLSLWKCYSKPFFWGISGVIKDYIDALGRNGSNGTAIYYMRKIFRKTHISYPDRRKYIGVPGCKK